MLSAVFRSVKVSATRVALCPGMSTAATWSREPEAWGRARWRNDTMPTTKSTAAMARSTIFAGGRFRFAVPNSSAMLIVGPDGTLGGGVLGPGVAVVGEEGEFGGTLPGVPGLS